MTLTHGFELLREQRIEELNTTARLYRHIKSGAELLSLVNDDENKVFGITFRTPASDSTGVPHIMEHSVLCGSRKYPVREPFVELMKGSLNTFLNAFTFPDKTCYPVASTNLQDFYNLVDVYLDAVFYPLISPFTLQQEGWHYELENPGNPLVFKGVVFNEMKGAYSSPDTVLSEKSQQLLFPDTTYGFDSGGDPQHIPDLTYEQFKRFHETFYHPANARIFFYGDDDPQERLRLLDAYLKDFDRIQPHSEIALQPRFPAPLKKELPYEAGDDPQTQKAMTMVNWLLPEAGDPDSALGLSVLEHILIGTPASPLRKALIDSGLGEDIAGGLTLESRQMFFSTGLKGIQLENAEAVEKLILDTLAELAHQGIDPETVDASLNTVEFALRENNTGRFPRGLAVMLRSLQSWLYGGDPIAPLAYEGPLGRLKERLKSGERYFEGLIGAHLLENSHRVTLVLRPDPNLGRQRAETETARLEQTRAAMSAADLQNVLENTRQLKLRQETPDSAEALATIPMLKLSDLEPKVRHIPLEVAEIGQSMLLYHDLFTNGILYLDLGFNLHVLPQQWLPYIPLFGRALLEMGTEKENFVQLLQRIGRTTGGIHPQTFTSTVLTTQQSSTWMFLRGKAMVSQVSELLAILRDILRTARLGNRERFRQMVLEEKSGMESSLAYAGHRIVGSRLSSRFNEADWANEQMNGVSSLFFLRQLATQVDQDWPSVLQTLEGIRSALLNQAGMICNITLDAANWARLQPQVSGFLQSFPSGPLELATWQPDTERKPEGLSMPSQINFVGKGANLYQAGYQLKGTAFVINNHLNGTWIWEKVRVQGGAYGGFTIFDQNSGMFTFLSYRDPNLARTLDVFDQTSQFLRQLDLDESELTKAIIGTIGDLDAYQLPDAKGYTSLVRHLLGITDEFRQRLRDELLATRPKDFHAFADVLDAVKKDGLVVVLGAPEKLESANQEHGLGMEILKVL